MKLMKMISVKEAAVLLVLASALVAVVGSVNVALRNQDLERLELLLSKGEAEKELTRQIKINHLQKKELRELRRKNRSVVARKPRRRSSTASLLVPIPEAKLTSGGVASF